MDTYLTNNCLTKLGYSELLIQPYSIGTKNVKRAFLNNYIFNKTQSLSAPSLKSRITHLTVGILLLIPIINCIALILLRNHDLKVMRRKTRAAVKIQSTFRQFKAKKIFQAKKAAKLKAEAEEAHRNKAAKTIQNAFHKFKAKKEKKTMNALEEVIRQHEAAIIIQTAFRNWKAKKAGKKPQPLSLWQRGKKLFWNRNVQETTERLTKVNMGQAYGCLLNASEATKALGNQQYKTSAYYAALALVGGLNASIRLFIPSEISHMNKAYQFALADVKS